MSDEHNQEVDERDTITPAERRNVWIWTIMLVVLFASATVITAGSVYKNKVGSMKRHNDRMNPDVGEGGTKPPPTSLPAGANPVKVQAGIYVDRIIDLSVKEASWPVDFYLWFRWNGAGVDPGEKLQIVDGSIESKEKVDEYTSGNESYVLYRVVARITKFFDVSRFPRDDHVLTINIESPASERRELLFVADKESSGLSSRVQIPGYSIYRHAIIEIGRVITLAREPTMILLRESDEWLFYTFMNCSKRLIPTACIIFQMRTIKFALTCAKAAEYLEPRALP